MAESRHITVRPKVHNTLNVYRTLPPSCVPFVVDDDYSFPFIERGECVVIDTEDRTARAGDIYVIQWNGGSRNLCQAMLSRWQKEGEEPSWNVGSMKRATPEELDRFLDDVRNNMSKGIPTWTGGWSEGPFALDHLESKLVGAVIGLYQPDVEKMIRNAGRAA